jgi:protease I
MFIQDDFEEMELLYPFYRRKEAGAKVTVAGPEKEKIYTGKHGYPFKAEIAIKEVREENFDGLIIPGGYAPDKLRKDPKVIELTKQFHKNEKMIAYICHAGWIPASANILKGVRCTSYESIKDDLIHAGANWVNEAVVVDRNIISSRFPDDLPQFCQAIIEFQTSALIHK